MTVTVDPGLIEAGSLAVAAGRSDSLSAWVNEAMTERAERDRKMVALAAAIADYETEFGEITAIQMAAQRRADRTDAVVVRSASAGSASGT